MCPHTEWPRGEQYSTLRINIFLIKNIFRKANSKKCIKDFLKSKKTNFSNMSIKKINISESLIALNTEYDIVS